MASNSKPPLPLMDFMTLRPVEPHDFSAIATLSAAAMMENDWNDYISPYRHKYPESFRQFYLQSVKEEYYSTNEHGLVVEVPDTEDARRAPRMKIVGYAVWDRDGDGEKAQVWRKRGSWVDMFERQALRLTDYYVSFFHLDRSVSRSRLAETDALEDEFSDVSERWHLGFLVVDPNFQRRGIGGHLVDWGIENAKKEGIPATLVGSQVGQSLYRKKGFRNYKLCRLREDVHSMFMIYLPEGVMVTGIDTRALE